MDGSGNILPSRRSQPGKAPGPDLRLSIHKHDAGAQTVRKDVPRLGANTPTLRPDRFHHGQPQVLALCCSPPGTTQQEAQAIPLAADHAYAPEAGIVPRNGSYQYVPPRAPIRWTVYPQSA